MVSVGSLGLRAAACLRDLLEGYSSFPWSLSIFTKLWLQTMPEFGRFLSAPSRNTDACSSDFSSKKSVFSSLPTLQPPWPATDTVTACLYIKLSKLRSWPVIKLVVISFDKYLFVTYAPAAFRAVLFSRINTVSELFILAESSSGVATMLSKFVNLS